MWVHAGSVRGGRGRKMPKGTKRQQSSRRHAPTEAGYSRLRIREDLKRATCIPGFCGVEGTERTDGVDARR